MNKIILTVIIVLNLINISYASNTVIISGHFNRAPFDWKEGKRLKGAAIEIIELIFKELGINTESRYCGPWNRVLHNLEKGEIDVMCGLYINEDRKKFAEFTEPFCEDRISVFVWHERKFNFDKWDDLKGKKFGDVLGATRGKEFDEWRKNNATIEYVPNNLNNFKKLEANRIDCFVTSHYPGLMIIKEQGYEGKIVPLKNSVKTKYLHYAISKKSKYVKYIPQINKRLSELIYNGTVEKIIKKNSDYYVSNHK